MSSRQEVVALAEHADDKVFERTGARLGLDHFVPQVRASASKRRSGTALQAARAWIDDHVKELPAGKVPSKSFHFPDPPTAREREDRRRGQSRGRALSRRSRTARGRSGVSVKSRGCVARLTA